MRALVKRAPGPGFDLVDAPEPIPGPGEVVVAVRTTSICGSDLHLYNWDPWMAAHLREFPRIVGHEAAGVVVSVGEGVVEPNVGDFVALETHIVCGRCYQCRTGRAHICRHLKILGFDINGAFADLVKVPAMNCIRVPSSIPREWASLMEPMGNAVDTVLAEPVSGLRIAILGCGPIGLMGIAIARASGASLIIASEPSPFRRQLALQMGADRVVNPFEEDLDRIVMDLTDRDGVDAVAEMSGSPKAFLDAIRIVTPGGWIGLLGLFSQMVSFDPNDLIMKGVRVHCITGRRLFSTWDLVKRFLASRQVNLDRLISHRLTLDRYQEAFQALSQGEAIKVIFDMDR
ncbi:MAG: L-threonine 3-dehydrogenase [Armatimonadetes bacterium]|nr:L-threonine 3-dehydrogenase [Armatimonadota bacterium]MDW8121197.1 L-threonine 3-dehydrogenase [Armatimonadota bacterium]